MAALTGPPMAWAGRSACSACGRWPAGYRADLILSNSLHSWYGWAVALLARRPHIWHAREIVTQSPTALRAERFLARRFARRVVAASEAVAAQLAPANVVIVHEEASPDEFRPGRAGQARHRYGLADGSPVVGYVGRIDTWKGLDVLLDAVPMVVGRRHDARFVIAGAVVSGKEAYAAALARRAADLGVAWLGPLSGPDAGDLIADLDCLVLASTTPEPWGLVLVEALACGVPVVATDAGGPLEILCRSVPVRRRSPGPPVRPRRPGRRHRRAFALGHQHRAETGPARFCARAYRLLTRTCSPR